MAKSSVGKKNKKQKKDFKKFEPRKIFTGKWIRVAIAFILILGIFIILKNAAYFKLQTIEVIDRIHATDINKDQLLRIYKGRNIFDIDIASMSLQIKNDYPVIKDVTVRRILPNKIRIDIVPRIPVAKLKLNENYPIDKEGMILSPGMRSEDIPVITGFSMWLRPKTGEVIKNQRIEKALELIRALNKSSLTLNYKVAAIDASNNRNLSFYLDNGMEVKIGGEDFLKRIENLKKNLSNPKLDKSNIKYIDLRFKDIVIGPK